MTTNQKIERILKDVPKFKGVYCYDEINDISHLNDGVIVINYVTVAEAQQGKIGHYVVFDNRQDQVKNNGWLDSLFFDPYGFAPDMPRELLHLPNTQNISKFISRVLRNSNNTNSKPKLKINNQDFQSKKPWDNLCGVYSCLYTINPNYETNPVFYTNELRVPLDHKLEQLFTELKVLGDPWNKLKRDARETVTDLAEDKMREVRNRLGGKPIINS